MLDRSIRPMELSLFQGVQGLQAVACLMIMSLLCRQTKARRLALQDQSRIQVFSRVIVSFKVSSFACLRPGLADTRPSRHACK
jgi:hypothetical protein